MSQRKPIDWSRFWSVCRKHMFKAAKVLFVMGLAVPMSSLVLSVSFPIPWGIIIMISSVMLASAILAFAGGKIAAILLG